MRFADYAESFAPSSWVILGCSLKPLSLGHFFLLRSMDSPFVMEGEAVSAGWDDFVVALCVCHFSFEEFNNFAANRNTYTGKPVRLWYAPWKMDENYFRKQLRKAGKDLYKRVKAEKLDIKGIKEKMKIFQDYLIEGTTTPKYWETDNSNSAESGAHWSQAIFTTAISELNYTRTEALNTPLRQLFNDFFKWAESQGSITLMKESEEELITASEKQTGDL